MMACSFGLSPPGVVPLAWPRPYQSDGTARRRLNLAVAMSCSTPNRLQIVGVEYPSFNANSAAFYSAQQRLTRGYRCSYTSLGYAATDLSQALARLNAIDPDYFVTIDPALQPAPDVFNQISLPAAEALMRDNRYQTVPTPDTSLLILSRRRE
jgi:hypothetical protein